MPQSGVQLLARPQRQVTVFCGATEIGQGSDDVLAAIVAEVLGIDPFDIRCVTGDTGMTPVDLGSYSSRVTVMMGNAAIQAAEKIEAQIAAAAAEQLEVAARPPGASRNGRVFFENRAGMTFAEAAGLAEEKFGTLGAVGLVQAAARAGKLQGRGRRAVAGLLVHRLRGRSRSRSEPPAGSRCRRSGSRTTSAGRINPVLARGQVEGSVYMGLAEALMEEQVFRRLPPKLSGALVHKIPSLLEYKSLTSLDMPEVDTVLIEDPDPNCPFGAKEVGQGPLLPVMPAVANAIYDAVGVRIDELPITPDKVLRALELKPQAKSRASGRPASRACPTPSRWSCCRRGKAAMAMRFKSAKTEAQGAAA